MQKILNPLTALSVLAVLLLTYTHVTAVGAATPVAEVSGLPGQLIEFPTCYGEYPKGFFEKTSAYTYIYTLHDSKVPATDYPGSWDCDYIWYHAVRLNWITTWNPFSTQYPGRGPIKVKSAAWTPTVFNPKFYTETDSFMVESFQELNHYYGNSKLFYFSTSHTEMKLEKFVGGVPIEIDLESVDYNSSIAYAFGRDPVCADVAEEDMDAEYRYNCRMTHTFKTDTLESGTYRLTFNDTYMQEEGEEEPPESFPDSFPESYPDSYGASTFGTSVIDPVDPYHPASAQPESINGFYQSFFLLTK